MSFSSFQTAFIEGARELAAKSLSEFRAQAESDARNFLNRTEADLRRWTANLGRGEISAAEFSDLVKGRAALAQLAALTHAGIGLTRLQRFRDGLVDLLISSALKAFL